MAWVDYDQLAAAYDHDRAVPLEALEPWRTALAAYLPPASGRPVLDLGAGTGLFAAAIAQWFDTEVVAVEPSEGMRRQAHTTRAHPRVAYVGGRGERLPLQDGCCDSAWLSTVIHHLSDLAVCAGELRRVLRPGGWVLVRNAFPDRPEPGSRLFTFWPAARAILPALPPSRPPSSPSRPWALPSSGWSRSVTSRPPASRRPMTAPASGPTACSGCSPTPTSSGGWRPGSGPRRPR
jgi:ubiquinone/menaquinone biosynthesis C-methylase UbiE